MCVVLFVVCGYEASQGRKKKEKGEEEKKRKKGRRGNNCIVLVWIVCLPDCHPAYLPLTELLWPLCCPADSVHLAAENKLLEICKRCRVVKTLPQSQVFTGRLGKSVTIRVKLKVPDKGEGSVCFGLSV